jgi:ubiquinone/menaquinone biosynthesis C-methylase UbiE
MTKSEKYFRKLLKITPLSVAIWRAVEAKYLSNEKMISPVLDLGCGFGEFMQAFAEKKIDVGLDINKKDLAVAKKSNKYEKVVLADARKMPFPNNSFNTIVSISTVEHIKYPQKLLMECYRVLKPGGRFILSIESDRVDENTFYRPFLSKIGLKNASNFLTKKYNSFFHRDVLLSNEKWKKLFEDQKFKIEKMEDIISPSVAKVYDIFMLTAWPSQILKTIFGKRIVFKPKIVEDLLVRFFLKYVNETNEGTNIFLVASKKSK